MSITPETLILLTQLIRFGVEGIEAINAGEKTEEEVLADFESMQDRVRRASDRWRETT